MDLQHLQNFLTILDQKSISNAASLIRIAQPALSRQLRALEDEVGAPLLIRHRWGVSPTPAGEVLAEHARDILRRVRTARDAISTLTSSPSGTLAVGVTASMAGLILPPLAMEAQALMPAVSLKLAEGYTQVLHQRLLAGELDVAVIHARERLPSLDTRPLMTEPIVFAGPAGLFRPGEAVTMKQVLQHQSLVTAPSGRLRLLYEQAAATAGAAPTRFMEVDSLPALLELLAAGAGVAMLAYSTIHAGVEAGRLSWAHLAPRPLTRKIVIARPHDRLETPAWLTMADLIWRIVEARAETYRWTLARAA